MPEPGLFGDVVLTVSDFVALVNQTFEYAYPGITIRGELANFRVSKNKWVYFDLKDENASVKFFGTVYQLTGPLEDGMVLRVHGTPRLHPLYGFSVTVTSMQPEGEGTIKRAAALLQAKLEAEGLFAPERKRALPYPPQHIGLVTSAESAAYVDFTKVLGERWRGVAIECADVQVQGEVAPGQITRAIEYFNQMAEPPEVVVITRGGGSAEDLYAFSTEQVTRAVAASRVPTLVAIGHEVDISLAELAADQRASTPSNAAELLVPHRREVQRELVHTMATLDHAVLSVVQACRHHVVQSDQELSHALREVLADAKAKLAGAQQLLEALNPKAVLARGFAIVRKDGRAVRAASHIQSGDIVDIELGEGSFAASAK